MRRSAAWIVMTALAGCTPSQDAGERARIDRLEARVNALEQQSSNRRNEAPHLFELVIPGMGGDRRLYATESECDQAKQQILNDAANRLAGIQADYQGRRVFGTPPSVSCIPT